MRSGTRPGLPARMPGADHDCATVADMAGCENFIWRRIDGFELIAAMPIEPLVKFPSVAAAVAVPPGPLTLQVICVPVAVAVNVYEDPAAEVYAALASTRSVPPSRRWMTTDPLVMPQR